MTGDTKRLNEFLDRHTPHNALDITFFGVRIGDMQPETAQRLAALVLVHEVQGLRLQKGTAVLTRNTNVPEGYFDEVSK